MNLQSLKIELESYNNDKEQNVFLSTGEKAF